MPEFVHEQNQTQKGDSIDLTESPEPTPRQGTIADTIMQLQRTVGNQAVLRMLQSREQDPEHIHMRQTASGQLEGDSLIDKPGEVGAPHQCADDAALDAEYEEWLSYDPEKDAEETALVQRINNEVFGPINQDRNKKAADSLENIKAQQTAFPTGALEPGASPEREKLFHTSTYKWLQSSSFEHEERQLASGFTRPLGDVSPTGKMVPHTFGGVGPPRTAWDYTGESSRSAFRLTRPDYVSGSVEAGDGPTPITDLEGESSISGYAEFADLRNQTMYVPQLGFGAKPSVDRRQIMCGNAPVEKPGVAKRFSGPKGQDVTGSDFGGKLHGGEHFFDGGTGPTITGYGEVLGESSSPGKPVYWYFHQLPDDGDKREKIDKQMRKKAGKVMENKRKKYENLKQYYLRRADFIAKYKDLL